MITRDIKQLLVVPAFRHTAKFIACGATNLGTCTCDGGSTAAGSCSWFPGYIIDRLGLSRSPKSLAVVPTVFAEIQSSDENAKFQHYAISFGLQHASSSGGTFADYSTGDWIENAGLWRQTTATATACSYYTAVQRDTADVLGGVLTTTTSTAGGITVSAGASSTGYAYYAGNAATFSLGGAQRYVRVVIKPIINSTACGSGGMTVSAAAVFGEQDLSPASYTGSVAMVKRIIVTTGCST